MAGKRGRLHRIGWLLHMNQPTRGQTEQRTIALLASMGLRENPGQFTWSLDRDRTLQQSLRGLRGQGHLWRSLRSWGSTLL